MTPVDRRSYHRSDQTLRLAGNAMGGQVLAMRPHSGNARVNFSPELSQPRLERLEREAVGQAVVSFGDDALSGEHREPAVAAEESVLVVGERAARAKQLELVTQALRQRHGARKVPKGLAESAIGRVVQDEKVPDPLVLPLGQA